MPNSTCHFDGCMKQVLCYGHCRLHVLAHVGWTVTSAGCFEWAGRRSASGYGLLGDWSRTRAHRLAWELFNDSPVPTGRVVRHSCDNPPCCNPSHLTVGTDGDNAMDAISRGRRRVIRRDLPNAVPECTKGHDLSIPGAVYLATISGRERAWCRECRREWDREYRARVSA